MRDMTIPKLFKLNVARYGNRVALREKDLGIWQRISWNAYWNHVRDFALGLKELGIEQNQDKVSILGDNCPEWLYADLAAQSSRAFAVGVYPTNVAQQVKYVLDNSESSFVVCKDQEQVDKVLEIKDDLPRLKRIIVIDMKGLRRYTDPMIISFEDVEGLGRTRHEADPDEFDSMVEATRPDDVAIMVYTSGTTGVPKGAMITHRNMLSMIEGLSSVLKFDETDSFVSALPLCHIAERSFSMIYPMFAGCTVNFAESVQTLQEDLRDISPTAFLTVPRIWEKMHTSIHIRIKDAVFLKRWVFNAIMPIGRKTAEIQLQGRTLPLHWKLLNGFAHLMLFRSLKNQLGLLNGRIFVSGAAPLSDELLRFYHGIGVPIRECFGMTECAGVCVIPDSKEIRVGRVGKPIPGIELKLAGDGEILLRGDQVFKGYYRQPELTDEAFSEGCWLNTGDVGRIAEDGQLEIVDRKKDLIINAYGKNIAPSEIENKLKFSPYINEAIIVGDGRKYLSALIQLELENVSDWARERGIPYTTYKSLAENPDVYKLLQSEVDRVNEQLARVEQVRKFKILTKELDQDDDEVTATMKVRRSTIEKKFKKLIDELY
ncbi:MAG: AMP-binding protein [Deltaproteobacteria bacterium]|nr:AMP-binding protein [Deltaproteobacteria bacterium]